MHLLEGVSVGDIQLSDGGAPHRVAYQRRDGSGAAELTAQWVVDAMGRRRLLQQKLGLTRKRGPRYSSAWFRVEGRVDLDDLVPAERKDWHERVPGRDRYHSTNHLMDKGYWVWIIPLSSGCTSIGIVTAEEYHPLEGFNSMERARGWLEIHEPELAAHIRGLKPMDFLFLRDYSHTSRQVFSHERWACVGEAAVFADPLYSPGSDLIGFTNSSAAWLIGQERKGKLTAEMTEEKSRFVIFLNESLTRGIQGGYPVFGCAPAMASKLLWDFVTGWAFVALLMFNQVFLDPEKDRCVRQARQRYFALSLRVHQMFRDWAGRCRNRLTFDYIDYLSIPAIRALRLRNLESGKSVAELVEDQDANLRLTEELAQVLFLLALEDVHPERMASLPSPLWLNAWGIDLDPDRWATTGLFTPTSQPRDLTHLHEPIRGAFRVVDSA